MICLEGGGSISERQRAVMASVTAGADAPSSNDAAAAGANTKGAVPLWLPVAAALLCGLFLSWPRFLTVWQTGAFFDSDDAMRLVEVRNLIAGQNWFDMTISRLDPPGGVFMHWSRVVDVPLALLIKMSSLVLMPDLAERAARLAFPLLLQGLLYLGIARIALVLMGRAAVIPAIFLTLLSGIMFGQFQPGRIDHHAPQIVLVVFLVGEALASFDPKEARRAAVAGLIAALSLSISIETLPFILAAAGMFVLLWILWGKEAGDTLLPSGLGLGLGLPLMFVATIGPAHWFDASCDAYSSAYLLPGLAGAAVCIGFGFIARHIDRWPMRLLTATAGGLIVLGTIAAVKPICLIDPFFGIDPLLRELWLDKVSEAMPLRRFFQREPLTALAFAMPVLLGTAASCWAACLARGLARRRWIFLAVMSCAGAAMSFWMIRVLGFAAPLALLGGAWCVIGLGAVIARSDWRKFAAASLFLVLPFSSIGWAIALSDNTHKDPDGGGACLKPKAIAALGSLKPGLIAAPIDAGSYILAFTPHKVLAAPYHRNNHGNLAVLRAFMAEPAAAADLLRAARVDYVALCSDLGETATLAARAPNGLAALLLTGQTPGFLTPLTINNAEQKSFYRVFKVKSP
jgi:hypothetical protein